MSTNTPAASASGLNSTDIQHVGDIGRQPNLPVMIAWEVVTQGIRIRLGRSLVTLTSVALGIAFLASILIGQVVQRGVQAERDARDVAIRCVAALEADLGQMTGKRLLTIGTPDAANQRLLGLLVAAGAIISDQAQDPTPGAVTLLFGGLGPTSTVSGRVAGSFTPAQISADPVPGRVIINFNRQATAEELAALAEAEYRNRARTAWITGIALAVTAIGITNAMLMSVTERFREIGTMKCLGAMGSFIRRVFVIEACLIGVAGGISGALLGMLASCISYGVRYGAGMVMTSTAWGMVSLLLIGTVIASVVLSVTAAVYPAWVAARMRPANALRSSV